MKRKNGRGGEMVGNMESGVVLREIEEDWQAIHVDREEERVGWMTEQRVDKKNNFKKRGEGMKE